MRCYRWADAPEDIRRVVHPKRPAWVAELEGQESVEVGALGLPWDRLELVNLGGGRYAVVGYEPKPQVSRRPKE